MSVTDSVAASRSTEPAFIGRLAPSPTGPLHLGHARSFLIAWWQARQAGGRLVLRQEDLDAARSKDVYRAQVRRDLEWLGIDWDGPEWVQSEHIESILGAADRLLARGHAYPCVCSRGDIQSVSAPHAGETSARYPGTCYGRFRTVEEAERVTGKLAGIRVCVPPRMWEFTDHVYGPQRFDVQADVGDFLIVRRDKVPSYQLAVVVDDARQGVTHVVRGVDLLDSTPRQLLLYEALELTPPKYYHIPLVVDATGARLAKRSAGLSLAELREQGVDPRTIVQWVAASVGVTVSKPVTPRDVLGDFDFARLPRDTVCVPQTW